MNGLPLYEVLFEEGDSLDFVSLVPKPAIQRNFIAFSEQIPIVLNEERREIYGPALIPDMPIRRRFPKQGDCFIQFSKETVKKMAFALMTSTDEQKTNLFHDVNQQPHDVKIFASFQSDKEIGISPLRGFEDTPDGTWFVGVKINNEDVWEKIKAQEIKGFSIEGLCSMRQLRMEEESREMQILRKIYEVVNNAVAG